MGFDHIQQFAQEYANNMSEVLGLDVTILDDQGVRVSGTGSYAELIGQRVPNGSFFETILQTGKPGMILETKKNESECSQCKFIAQCTELATIGFPIFKRNRVAGVIGMIGFSYAQKEIIRHDADKLLNFLSHMSSLLEHRLLLLDVLQNHPLQRTSPASHAELCTIHETKNSEPARVAFSQLLGQNASFQQVLRQAKKVLNSPSHIMLRGESGTGKELLAQALHYESKRGGEPFVVVNCAAIPESLLESELFGYEAGAFTGARRTGHRGKIEQAHRGTLFLDEVGELPIDLQAKLLRVLQDKQVERLGGSKSIAVDVRIIAATHRPLEQMVQVGTFRQDLYYRLQVIPLVLPALRERVDDIPLLLRHFIHKFNARLEKEVIGLDPDLERWLLNYSWPGNVRQFENVMEYMVNMADSVILGLNDLPPYLELDSCSALSEESKGRENRSAELQQSIPLEQQLATYEKEVLYQYVQQKQYRQDKGRLAQELGISLSTLYRKLEKYKLS